LAQPGALPARPLALAKLENEIMGGLMLFVAQGFGSGRIPFMPGTFGSAVGLLWLILLLATGSIWLYLSGLLLGIVLSIWLCGVAETILKQTDPPSVVLDEIVAIPLCFLAWVIKDCVQHGHIPAPATLFNRQNWEWTALIFVLFRFFDILKPWPVRQSQNLRSGWGITVDDLLAAIYVCAFSLLFVR
jgi:phosphatidylglycerophosphatase A